VGWMNFSLRTSTQLVQLVLTPRSENVRLRQVKAYGPVISGEKNDKEKNDKEKNDKEKSDKEKNDKEKNDKEKNDKEKNDKEKNDKEKNDKLVLPPLKPQISIAQYANQQALELFRHLISNFLKIYI
jgi:ABC-type Zn2+ transport system substrate-binding protein/surface adhesin